MLRKRFGSLGWNLEDAGENGIMKGINLPSIYLLRRHFKEGGKARGKEATRKTKT
jgi:hypothetical protein